MRRNLFALKSVAAVLTTVVLLAGCGQSSKPAETPAPAPAPAQPAKEQPAAPAPKPKLEKTSMKLGVSVKDTGFLPVYVADAKGFFKEEGVNVELVNFSGGSAQAQAVAGGAVDFAAGAITEVIDGYVANKGWKAFWAESNYPVYVWYGKPEYNSIKDLKGKGKIAVSRLGSLTHQISAWVVKQAGLDPEKDVQYVQAGNPLDRVAALKAGQVDAIPATPPGTFILAQDGYKILAQLKDYLPEFQYEVFYATDKTIKENPETLKAVIRAWTRATQYAKKNPKEATDILMKYLGAKEEDRESLAKTVEQMLPSFREDGQYATDSINVFLQFYKEKGDLKEVPKLDAILDYSMAEYMKANPVK